jgi:hypothetical protein
MAATLKPLINTQPGQKTRLWAAFEGALRQFALRFDHALPASVISYDRTNNIAEVQPLIQVVTLDGTPISRHPLASVPVVSLGGGGFHMNFPLKSGNLGWIFATDRDYTTFMQTLKESVPNSTRAHKFEDSLFLPDVMRQYAINAADATAMVVQSTDGTTRIAIDVGGAIRITAPTGALIDTPLATFTHDVEIKGNLTVDVNSHVKGNETVDGTLTNDGIDVTTHGHVSESPGVRTGNMEA